MTGWFADDPTNSPTFSLGVRGNYFDLGFPTGRLDEEAAAEIRLANPRVRGDDVARGPNRVVFTIDVRAVEEIEERRHEADAMAAEVESCSPAHEPRLIRAAMTRPLNDGSAIVR